MNRRNFCRTTLSAALAASYPFTYMQAVHASTSIAAVSLDGNEIELERAALKELGQAMQGPVLLSGQPGYDSARKVWNGMHDKHPALIARCRNNADIQQAVTFAREREMLLAVRGGGHSWPGKSVCDGGMMLDLAEIYQQQWQIDYGYMASL